MTQYKISIHDKAYNEWTIYNSISHDVIETLDVNPSKEKLFNGDIFECENGICTLVHSLVRNSVQMPGVLMLDSNMYGKYKNKYLYKCIPDDKHLPIFLIPYEEKHIGFSKKKINKYITFQFKTWDNNHPEAIIKNNIGTVEDLDHFYEYQLFCKSLNASIQGFGKDAKRSIDKINTKNTFQKIISDYDIEKREVFIFSIDGNNTQDFDDAFSIVENDNEATLSIYITNVAIWMDVLNLWDSFSERISSIYLPDRKRPMLPTVLSNILCSLYKQQQRIAISMDIHFVDYDVKEITYSNVAIKVSENYFHNNIDINNVQYASLLKYTNCIFKKHKLIKKIENSHDVVSYLMMYMNYYSSKILAKNECGVFRSISLSDKNIPKNIPNALYKFVKIWNSSSGQYTTENTKSHDLLDIESYIHITSPMRRLVDLLNIIMIQNKLNLYKFTSNAHTFYNRWINRLDYINVTTRSIRKIQMDCNLLHWCNSQKDLTTMVYDGYVFDKIKRSDGLYQYMVFINNINMASRITIRYELDNYSQHKFSLHIFNKKDSFKRKVRLHYHEVISDDDS
jgi:exoribonuclease R